MKPLKSDIMKTTLKLIALLIGIFLQTVNVEAQNGPYLRFSLGPGSLNEYQTLDDNGLTHGTKNHAIGWGFQDKYTLFFNEFGASSHVSVSDQYQYINTDVYGIGVVSQVVCLTRVASWLKMH